ncbi:MAG: hypothetical protein DHS20C18_15760 [Saprospiraceae bacterium]|nr:MAG: hypothetical protein DHS20C18_15760 [Saprospiraceae bacterium]
MFKKFWFLFLVLLIEGASLMAVELMGAKLLAPTMFCFSLMGPLAVATSAELQQFQKVQPTLLFKGELVKIDFLFLYPQVLIFSDDQPNPNQLSNQATQVWRNAYNKNYTRFSPTTE